MSHLERAIQALRSVPGTHTRVDELHARLLGSGKLATEEFKSFEQTLNISESVQQARAAVRGPSLEEAIVQMAHTLGLRVVAEGVETEAQRDLLVAMGCDELQGYLFARPMTAQALELWATGDAPDVEHDFRPSLFDETHAGELDAMPSSPSPERPPASSRAHGR